MPLRRHEPAQCVRQIVRGHAGRLEEPGALHQLHGGARGGRGGATAAGGEARLHHALALDADREAHEVAAGGTARRARVRPANEAPAAPGRVQVVVEISSSHNLPRVRTGSQIAPTAGMNRPQLAAAASGVEPCSEQAWVSSGTGLDPIPSRTPDSHDVGSNIETAGVQARAAKKSSS